MNFGGPAPAGGPMAAWGKAPPVGKAPWGKAPPVGKAPWGKAPWAPTPGGGWAKQYPPGQAGIPYGWYPGYGVVQ